MTTTDKLKPGEILHKVVESLNLNITLLASQIGEQTGTLYQITSGRNGISNRIARKIKEHYPQVSLEFLKTGEGAPLIGLDEIIHKNSTNNMQEEIYRRLVYLDLRMDKIEQNLQMMAALLKELIEQQSNQK